MKVESRNENKNDKNKHDTFWVQKEKCTHDVTTSWGPSFEYSQKRSHMNPFFPGKNETGTKMNGRISRKSPDSQDPPDFFSRRASRAGEAIPN